MIYNADDGERGGDPAKVFVSVHYWCALINESGLASVHWALNGQVRLREKEAEGDLMINQSINSLFAPTKCSSFWLRGALRPRNLSG